MSATYERDLLRQPNADPVPSAEAVHSALSVVNTLMQKLIHTLGIMKTTLLKAKCLINKNNSMWLTGSADCSLHRSFILQMIFIAKLKGNL